MARTVGVYKGPANLQTVFGRNVPNCWEYATLLGLFRALGRGDLDGAVLPSDMVPTGFCPAQIVNGFAYVRPSDEVRRRRARARITARRTQRAASDTPMRCASFVP